MTADGGDLEDFIRVQKQKISRERQGLDDDKAKNTPRRQWDRSNPDGVKQAVKENVPERSETPEIPLAAKMGQHEERHKKMLEEKRKEYNQMQSRQTRSRRVQQNDDGGGALPGLRDSQSAKQRKIAERNREYNEFLKAKGNTGRRGQQQRDNTQRSVVNNEKSEPQPRPNDANRPRQRFQANDVPAPRPNSQNRATSPISHEFGAQNVPKIDLGGGSTAGRDYGPYTGQDTGAGPLNSSLPIDDRAGALRRKQEERNREYNDFLKQAPTGRLRKRETSPSDVGRPEEQQQPRKGWGTPRYDEILEQKRREESTYRQGAFTIRAAVSEGALDQSYDESRKLDRLDDVIENRKVRFRNELSRPSKPVLDDDGWLDFYKSPSRYDADFDQLPRSYTTLDQTSFQNKAERVKSAPLRDQGQGGPPGRTPGNAATGREQYRLDLEQQMKLNAENRRREKQEEMSVNASGLTEITRQNVDVERRGGRRSLDGLQQGSLEPASFVNAAGSATLGPYNSPMDEAYYYYARRDPLDVGMEIETSGYVPSTADRSRPHGARRTEESKQKVSFGPATGSFGPATGSFGPATGSTQRYKNQSDMVSVAAIPTVTENDQKDIAKNKSSNYNNELQRQIEENRQKKKLELEQRKREDAKLAAEIANYNPYGKGGGGAPLKDTQGNVLADLKRMHKSNADGTTPAAAPAAAGPPVVPSLNIRDQPMSVYDTYVSPRQTFNPDLDTTRTTAGGGTGQEPNFARGGHGIFGDPKTDAEKTAADRYKNDLQLQIEEKKRREEERKAKQRAEEEKEMQRIEEARLKMQREYDEEVRKQREKEENARKRNEELKLQAEEKRREAERLRREQDEKSRMQSEQMRTQTELDRERARLTISPPIPTLRGKNDTTAMSTARRSPPVPALTKRGAHFDDYYHDPQPSTSRAGSADVLNKLEVIRKQLQSERQRVENQLERDKFEVEVFDPRLVKAAPIPAIPVIMSPPVVHTPPAVKSPEVDVFETAINKAPVTVKRPPVNAALNSDIVSEFNKYKNRDTDSRQKFRQMYPDQPTSDTALETQQLAMLRQQEEELQGIRDMPRGSRSMLKSDTEYIDTDGVPVQPIIEDTPRERRRKKKVKVESPKSSEIGSTTSLNTDMSRKNDNRMKKLRDLQGDDESLNDPDDILDRFMLRQQHQRPNSGTTLNDEEAWLRPSH